MEEKTLYEVLTDENDDGNIVLDGDDGEDLEFEQLASISLDDRLYCILRPLNLPNGVTLAEDEAFVFQYVNDENGEALCAVDDEELENRIIEEYNALCEDEEE